MQEKANGVGEGIFDVVIIGAGFGGVYALKHCIEEGLSAVALEKSEHIGGVWEARNAPGAVHDFTYAVTSRLYLSPSDFPPPESWPEFPHSSLVLAHLRRYAERFNLMAHIRTGTVATGGSFDGGLWNIVVSGGEGKGGGGTIVARKLVVATGANTCPVVPPPLREMLAPRFRGLAFHSHFYGPELKAACAGKRVLIIGGSDTAADIAGDLCRLKDAGGRRTQVHMSIRDGQWFQDRILGANSPADMYYSRLINFMIKNVVGKRYVHNTFGEDGVQKWWGKGGSDIDAWQPSCDYLNSYYNKGRDVVRLVSFGLVHPCGRVVGVLPDGVHVRCASVAKPFPVDVIVLSTGYKHTECMPDWLAHAARLPRFKLVFPVVDEMRDSIAFVGYVRPYLTSIPMLVELQARWVARVFSGKARQVPVHEQARIASSDAAKQAREFPCHSGRIPFLVDPYDYADDLAGRIGARPPYARLVAEGDWALIRCLLFDSWNHFAYRLNDEDPDKRRLARDVLLHYHDHKTCRKIRAAAVGIVWQLANLVATAGLVIALVILVLKRRACR